MKWRCTAHHRIWRAQMSGFRRSFEALAVSAPKFGAYFTDLLRMWHKYNSWTDEASRTISRQKVQRLTRWCRASHICVSKLTNIGSNSGLSHNAAPSHYPNQCWNSFLWTPISKLRWNLHLNLYISVQDNAFENVGKMTSILSRPRYFKVKRVVQIFCGSRHVLMCFEDGIKI